MIITLLAVTQPKQSITNDNVIWYKEYAIGQFESEKERCEFGKKYSNALNYLNPHVSMRRRVDVFSDGSVFWDWDYLTVEKDIYSAALNIGDTDYYSAKSCNHIHEQVKLYSERMNSLQKELQDLENEIVPNKFARQSRLQGRYQSQYDAALKKNRLYSRVHCKSAGAVSDEKIDAIRLPIRKSYKCELEIINERISGIKKELAEMKVEDF